LNHHSTKAFHCLPLEIESPLLGVLTDPGFAGTPYLWYFVTVKNMSGWFFIVIVLAAGLALAGCKTMRSGYDSAPYRVVSTASKFEIRDYLALTVVETPMAPSGEGANGGFTRLFRFITGSNEAKQKISMTTPVFMFGSTSNATMAFVMPAKLTPAQVPKPSDGSVTVRELEPGRFAVLRFSGGRNAEKESEMLNRLKAWMAGRGLKAVSAPVYGYFDPPWTPAFLRRNEVMLRIGAER
jgi:hypothetical protein